MNKVFIELVSNGVVNFTPEHIGKGSIGVIHSRCDAELVDEQGNLIHVRAWNRRPNQGYGDADRLHKSLHAGTTLFAEVTVSHYSGGGVNKTTFIVQRIILIMQPITIKEYATNHELSMSKARRYARDFVPAQEGRGRGDGRAKLLSTIDVRKMNKAMAMVDYFNVTYKHAIGIIGNVVREDAFYVSAKAHLDFKQQKLDMFKPR